jgi:hypothetical protein
MPSPTSAYPAPSSDADHDGAQPAAERPAADRDAAADAATAHDIAAFYQRADALCRCAMESCRQHERLAHLVQLGALPAEQRAARTLVTLCDEALLDLAGAYERAADRAHPPREDPCWHAANGLWLAAREFARRTRTSVRAGRSVGEARDGGERTQFAELALDYDLEASALLLLKHATEAYRKARPEVI